MTPSLEDWTAHLLGRLRQVQQNLGIATGTGADPDARFADLLDSMGMVDFLLTVAEDLGVVPAAIEELVHRRFGTVIELAGALHAAGWVRGASDDPTQPIGGPSEVRVPSSRAGATCWLSAARVSLPATVQSAASINGVLHRPPGWLEEHAGIQERRVWADQDPLAAAAEAGWGCLDQTGLAVEDVGALLVTAEAPPLLAGLAAALHHRLDLRPGTVALEVGGACTGFLAALWLSWTLVPQVGPVLVIAVEAPSQFLPLQPGPAGEAAALFGDAAAACLVCGEPEGAGAVPLVDVVLGADGKAGPLLRVERSPLGAVELRFDGQALAGRAVRVMAQAVRELAQLHGLAVTDLAAVVAHGGNGRMPALMARRLGLSPERVWSETPHTGNLGSASLPAAWAAHQPRPPGPVAWAAVGAGLTWAAALTAGDGRSGA